MVYVINSFDIHAKYTDAFTSDYPHFTHLLNINSVLVSKWQILESANKDEMIKNSIWITYNPTL